MKNKSLDAIVIERFAALNGVFSDCDLGISSSSIFPVYYAFGFPLETDDSIVRTYSDVINKLYQKNLIINLLQLNTALSNGESCNNRIEIPVSFTTLNLLWLIVAIGIGISAPMFYLYRKYG